MIESRNHGQKLIMECLNNGMFRIYNDSMIEWFNLGRMRWWHDGVIKLVNDAKVIP